MRFAKEGYLPAAIPALVGVALWLLVDWTAGAALLVVGLLVLLFFRDPERRPPADERKIVAPADGRVVSVDRDVRGHEMADGVGQRIAIFMSPLDVHVNRMPAAGEVSGVQHRLGSFRAAYSAEASAVNESNAVAVRLADGRSMVVVQIAGWLARRIVCKVRPGDVLARGERFGLIMFGSRVDVYLPADVSITVAPGARVTAGATVIAEFAGGRRSVSEGARL